MSINTLYKYVSGTNYQITEEEYADVGASTFQFGTVKRAFKGGTDLEIWDSAKTTQLVEGLDYTIENEDFNYTDKEGFSVYTGVKVIDVAYQSGTIYITYKTIGSYTDPDIFNDFFEADIGTVKAWSSDTLPDANHLFATGDAVLKADYPIARDRWIVSKGAVTFSSSSGLLATFTAHGFSTGARVSFTTTGSLPTGISADTTYYVIYVGADTFKLATTEANALAGTAIAYTNAGSDCVLVSCPWGIKDADEMYLPDFEGWVPVGKGQATINARAKDNLSLGAGVEDGMQRVTGNWTRSTANADGSPVGADADVSGCFGLGARNGSDDRYTMSATSNEGRPITFNNATSPNARVTGNTTVDSYTRENKKAINYIVRVL